MNNLDFLTWNQMLASEGKPFFVEIYRNGIYKGKGLATLSPTSRTVAVNLEISNGVHDCWVLEDGGSLKPDESYFWMASGGWIQLKADLHPVSVKQYSYQ